MKSTGLSLNDYIDATDGIIDTIWELRLKEEEGYVWREDVYKRQPHLPTCFENMAATLTRSLSPEGTPNMSLTSLKFSMLEYIMSYSCSG